MLFRSSAPTQLPIPPFPNPHHEVSQPTYNFEVKYYQTYLLELNILHPSSRNVLQRRDFLNVIEGQHQEEEYPNEEIKRSRAALDEEKKSKSDVEKVPSCLPAFPPCVQENNQQKEEDLNVIIEEDIQGDPTQQVDQGHHNYIDIWFQTVIKLHHHTLLQQYLIQSQSNKFISHIQVHVKA